MQESTAISEMQGEAAPADVAGRHRYIDWLRVLAMGVVFLFHSAHFFDATGWHVKNAQTAMPFTLFVNFAYFWMMPLFFLLAGASSYYSLQSRAPRGFLCERALRLGVPFLMGMWLLTMPQKYLQDLHQGQFAGSFVTWLSSHALPHYAVRLTPGLFGSWGHHLWFLPFLLLYSLVAVLLPRAGKFLRPLAVWPGCLWLLGLLALVNALRPLDAEYSGWMDFFFWLVIFAAGFLLLPEIRFRQWLARAAVPALGLGLLTFVGILVCAMRYDVGQLVFPVRFSLPTAIFSLLWDVNTVLWLIAWCGLGITYLTTTPRWFAYANEAVLPFYVLHQTVLLAIGFFVVQWPLGIWPKFACIAASGFLITLALYEFVVRRIPVLRFLFGMRAAKR